MGPDLKLTEKSQSKSNSKVVSTNKQKGSMAQNQENKGMQGNMDIGVDFAECMNSGESEMIDVECQDCIENSSSFGDTVSGDDDGLLVNDEVESPMCDPALLGSLFDGRDGLLQMRKRRLTDHWRRFIHPLLWRCKWLEVKLHELKSQTLKYERELAEYDRNKQFEFNAKSQTLSSKIQRKEVMKRKKRKRIEDTADVASYMSHHNIFSYYESRKSAAPAACDDWGDLDTKTINDNGDIGCNDGWPFQSIDDDNWTEQILGKIEVVRSRMHILKTRMDKVVNENSQRFLTINMLSSLVPPDPLNNSRNHLCTEKEDRNSLQCTTSQHASECDKRYNLMPESAVSSDGEVASLPDIVRSMSQRLLEISSETTEGEILIPNPAAKEELRDFGSAIIQQVEKPHISMENLKTVSPGDNLPINTSLQSNAQPPLSKSKQADKKRSRRKQETGLGRWSRRSSG